MHDLEALPCLPARLCRRMRRQPARATPINLGGSASAMWQTRGQVRNMCLWPQRLVLCVAAFCQL